MQRSNVLKKLFPLFAGLTALIGATYPASSAFAAAPWTGTIGRIDLRTGYADAYLGTSYSQHDIVVRSSTATSGNAVCVIEEGTGFIEHFLSVATAAMLAGLTVTIERHGAAQGQYKCAWISVSR